MSVVSAVCIFVQSINFQLEVMIRNEGEMKEDRTVSFNKTLQIWLDIFRFYSQ